MTDRLTHLDERIHQLKKKREKVQAQQALSFMRESQKLLKEDFSPILALTILTESWTTAPDPKKENWKKRSQTFPNSSSQRNGEKAQSAGSEAPQS